MCVGSKWFNCKRLCVLAVSGSTVRLCVLAVRGSIVRGLRDRAVR